MTRRRLRSTGLLAGLLLATVTHGAAAETVTIATWADGELERWKVEEFAGRTDYRIESGNGERWLRAEASDAASGLFFEKRIDLRKTPWLTWRWRIDEPLRDLDERSKAGDDYAARIYVVISGGAFFWNTKALNYVWSGSQATGAAWPNAYTDNARMVAVRGKDDAAGEWVTEKRNVLEDLKAAFGEDFDHIDAVAIMTDADNSDGKAAADYGALSFTAE